VEPLKVVKKRFGFVKSGQHSLMFASKEKIWFVKSGLGPVL
jgi:hypothetical protein